MIKQLLFLILLSILVIFFKHPVSEIMHGLLVLHDRLVSMLAMVFSNGLSGNLLKNVIGLLLIPLLCGLLIAMILWMLKRSAHPHSLFTVWIVWVLILAGVLVHG